MYPILALLGIGFYTFSTYPFGKGIVSTVQQKISLVLRCDDFKYDDNLYSIINVKEDLTLTPFVNRNNEILTIACDPLRESFGFASTQEQVLPI
jgi:hypothetical protein